ncbi:DUF3857 domain-containing protein [Flavobacterium cerinum]|uniref:DUF3857 domain-containing protein n=1 Tax=Flavobacterium cerinum TaxID=2502784 RepID=A0ABY5IYL6_9FLAO|nr:DUF3857 domain-containing protein [Flavobacterium cerinum]UUC46833.1 DUF3857 domain-containing protein [Flavobacterium cerinum]
MNSRYIVILLFTLVCSLQSFAQDIFIIPDSLKENTNAIVKTDRTSIQVVSVKNMLISKKQIVLVLNEQGMSGVDGNFYYDTATKIKSVEAIVYDKFGKEIKKIKRKDFIDHSVADGFSVFSDNRALTLNYIPTEYPFTIELNSEVETTNTGFVMPWYPVKGYAQSLLKSEYKITYPYDLKLKYKGYNLDTYKVLKTEKGTEISFTLENVPALRHEEYAPGFKKLIPYVRFGFSKFSLEGTDGVADNWKDFGLWMNEKLLQDTQELPLETQTAVKKLVENEKNPIDKARKIYRYVQDKTRYISIQVGIGGWKPMKAVDVDRLGYGDCKALSNYTKALLNVVGIPSFYTVIYGNTQKEDIQDDLVSIQGNHAILTIPDNGKYYFLECTSQITPFAYQGKFTDDRMALLMKPEGGELIRTADIPDAENSQKSKGNYTVDSQGNFKGEVLIVSEGTQYESKYELKRRSKEESDKFYKKYFANIENLKVNSVQFEDDPDNVKFKERIAIQAEGYGTPSGERLLFPANAFNVSRHIPQRYRNRKLPFHLERGYHDYDEIIIQLPEGFTVEGLPQNTVLNTKFGEYKTEYTIQGKDKIVAVRSMLLKRGMYPKEDYEEFRKFMELTARNDNAKISLTKNKS